MYLVKLVNHLRGLLSSILMNKLPKEFRLVTSREIGDGDWQIICLIFSRENLRQEKLARDSTGSRGQPTLPKPKRREDGKTHVLLNGGDSNCLTCTFCKGKHPSKDCRTVTDVLARKELVKKYGDVFFPA